MAGSPSRTDRVVRFVEWKAAVTKPLGRENFLRMCDEMGDLDEVCRELDLPRSGVVAFLAEHAALDEMANRALERHADRLVAEAIEIAAGEPVAVVDAEGKPVLDEAGAVLLVEQSVQRDTLRVRTNLQAAGFYKRSRYGEKLDVTLAVVDLRGALDEARARTRLVGSGTADEDGGV